MTIRRRFLEAKPRLALAKIVKISAPYAHDIAMGKPIGGTETLARIAGRLGLDDAEIGASVREMYPEAFGERPADTAA